MNVIRRLFILVFSFLVIVSVYFYAFIRLNGKEFLTKQLTQYFKRPVTIEDVTFLLPMGLRCKNLSIQGVLTAPDVRVQIGLPFFYQRRLVLSRLQLLQPVFYITRNQAGDIAWSQASSLKNEDKTKHHPTHDNSMESHSSPIKKKVRLKGVYIDFFLVDGGRIEFLNMSSERFSRVDMKNMQLKARSAAFPQGDIKTRFDMNAVVAGQKIFFAGNRMQARGWVNFGRLDMDSTVRLVAEGGRIDLLANLKSENNVLQITGTVNLSGLEEKKETHQQETVQQSFFETLGDFGVGMEAEFSFTTSMSRPQIEKIALKGNLIYEGKALGANDSVTDSFEKLGQRLDLLGAPDFDDSL